MSGIIANAQQYIMRVGFYMPSLTLDFVLCGSRQIFLDSLIAMIGSLRALKICPAFGIQKE
jgi:hypothetical protein